MISTVEEHLKNGKYKLFRIERKEAIKVFREALAEYPNDSTLLGWLAITLAISGDNDEALNIIENEEEIEASKVNIVKGIISDYRDDDKHLAIEYFSKAISFDSNNELAYAHRGLIYALQNRGREALSDFDRALDINASSYVYIFLGRSRDFIKDTYGAIDAFNKAIELDPEIGIARRLRAEMLIEIGELDSALVDLNNAIKIRPKDKKAWANRSYILAENGDIHGAMDNLNKTIELDPEYAWAWDKRGALKYDAFNDVEGALADYNKAIELNPEEASTWNRRGFLKRDALNDIEGALTDYNKAIEFDPEDKNSWANRGSIKAENSDPQGALYDFNKALEIDRNYAWAINQRASLFKSLGRYELSLADRSRYYELEGVPEQKYENKEVQDIYENYRVHFQDLVKPELDKTGEKLIENWICYMIWGYEETQLLYKGKQTRGHHGKYGMGFLCLSDNYLRIISIGNLSRKYAKRLGIGIGRKIFYVILSNYDFRGVEKKDKIWTVPFKDINGIFKDEEAIHLTTSVEHWGIRAYFDEEEYMLASLELARSGNLRNIIDLERLRIKQKPSKSGGDILNKIERLANLHEKGIITYEEFEQKKEELLARL